MSRPPSKYDHNCIAFPGSEDRNADWYPGPTEEAKRLRESIKQHFPQVPCPPINQITLIDPNKGTDDDKAVAEDFADLSWYDLSEEVVYLNHSNLSLVTPSVRCRVIPAFMMYAISETALPRSESVAFWLLMELSRFGHDELSQCTLDQKTTLASYVKFVLNNSRWYELTKEEISKSPSDWWKDVVEDNQTRDSDAKK